MQTEGESGSPLQVIQSLTQCPSRASVFVLVATEGQKRSTPPGAEIPSKEPNGVHRGATGQVGGYLHFLLDTTVWT